MISFDRIKEDVKERNYSPIPFPLSSEDFNSAADAFMEFLKLSQEVKDSLYGLMDPLDDGSELGYARREKSEEHSDDKEFFHYNEDHIHKLENIAHFDNPIVQNFLGHAKNIYDFSIDTLREVTSAFEGEYPNISSDFFPHNLPFRGFLRFLKYDIKNPGEILAGGHYDRGAATLALAESAPGLQIGKNPEKLKEIEHSEYTALFMPSWGFRQITGGSFPPAWHNVVKRGEDRYSDEISRWAIVFFADVHGLPYPTYEQTHTPLS